MISLTEQLEQKSRELLKRFKEVHPIWAAIRQPLTAETKRIMHRIFRVYVEVGPEWCTFADNIYKLAQIPDEKEMAMFLRQQFSADSVENLLAQLCRPFFGDISDEVRAEKSCDVLIQMRALMERVLATKDVLHCLVMFYAPTQIGNIFWGRANQLFSPVFPGFKMEGIDEQLNAFREAIDSHPKAQTIDERTLKKYVNTYMEFLELDIKAYNYIYDLS